MTEPAAHPADADPDILIVGAGPVGLTLARALAPGPWRIALLDRRPRGAGQDDPRALALAYGARQLLEPLGAWPQATASAESPIREIHVSQRGGFGRTLIRPADYGLPALGHVLRYGALTAALEGALDRQPTPPDWIAPGEISRLATLPERVSVLLANGRTLHPRLVVHAEGTPGDDAACAAFRYRQHAVICEVSLRTPHHGRAWERFTPDGPLALLPLGEGYAVVFTVPPEKAEALLALDDNAFARALEAQFGRRLEISSCGPRSAFPLALRLRKTLVAPREVWIGNAAQTLHPVSGQGFNLGLRDAVELAERLLAAADASGTTTDPGAPAPLAAYARRRQPDRLGGAVFTDGIVRLFSNDLPPLRTLRGLGLLALDTLPPLRHAVAKRMLWGARAWL